MYIIKVDHLKTQYTIELDSTSILMRMDSATGSTIWAKNIVFDTGISLLRVYEFVLKDDLVWWLLTKYQSLNYFGVISQIDFNGNLIQSFSVINKIDAPKSDIKFFVPEFIDVADDHSIVLWSETTYYQNEMGYLLIPKLMYQYLDSIQIVV